MARRVTEINRFGSFRLFSVTEIILSPYKGEDIFGGYFRFLALGPKSEVKR
jgi:hypothetical protein